MDLEPTISRQARADQARALARTLFLAPRLEARPRVFARRLAHKRIDRQAFKSRRRH